MSANFCPDCTNLLLAETDNAQAIYSCGICGYQRPLAPGLLSITQHISAKMTRQVDDPNYRYDPALPRSRKVECPTCSKKGLQPEVVIFNQDSDTYVSSYMCIECNLVWEPSAV